MGWISNEPNADPPTGEELAPIVQNGVTRRTTLASIAGLGGTIGMGGFAVTAAAYEALTAPDGAAKPGSQLNFPAAELNSQADINRQKLNLLQFVPRAQHDAIYARNSTYDCADAFRDAINSLGSNGGDIEIPNGTILVGAPLTIGFPEWTPCRIWGAGGSRINWSHNGVLFDDQTGAARIEYLGLAGPGLGVEKSTAVKSKLGQGWVKGCDIRNTAYGVDVSGTTNGLVHRNRFTLCNRGVFGANYQPQFGNMMTVEKNYFDHCNVGADFTGFVGLVFETNAFERNELSLYMKNTQNFHLRGSNWFEDLRAAGAGKAWEIVNNCTGIIDPISRVVGTQPGTIDYPTCAVQDFLTPATCMLFRVEPQKIATNTPTNIQFDSMAKDPIAMHDDAVGSDQVMIKVPGTYEIDTHCCLGAKPLGGNKFGRLAINVNDVNFPEDSKILLSDQPQMFGTKTTLNLVYGDIVRSKFVHNAGTGMEIEAGTARLNVRLVEMPVRS